MEITVERLKHSLAVAVQMKELVRRHPEKYSLSPDDAFVLGILHDIGYAFSQNQSEHAAKGGEVLKAQGYRYWREVFYHGIPQTDYQSSELQLLNYADLITGPTGELMTVQERIRDIAKRYGKGSLQERDAIELAKLTQAYFPEAQQSE